MWEAARKKVEMGAKREKDESVAIKRPRNASDSSGSSNVSIGGSLSFRGRGGFQLNQSSSSGDGAHDAPSVASAGVNDSPIPESMYPVVIDMAKKFGKLNPMVNTLLGEVKSVRVEVKSVREKVSDMLAPIVARQASPHWMLVHGSSPRCPPVKT